MRELKQLPKNEFLRRRRQLMRMMGEGTIAIIPSSSEKVRNRDVDYPFRQDSDFLYMTGFNEPESVMVLIPGREQGEYVLFCRERDALMETWNGRRAGQAGAVEQFGADDSFPIGDIDDILPGLLEHCHTVYYTLGKDGDFDRQLMDWVNQLRKKSRGGSGAPHEFINLDYLLHDMRLYKSRSEVRLMKEAARVAVAAHERAMRACRPNMFEYELEAEYLYEFRRNGTEPAYPSIVGGGENACILHYTENNCRLKAGELVLIDAGAEYQGYASDITRTFPVDGKFSPAQRDAYDVVLAAQKAAIAEVQPGKHWDEPHLAAVKVLTEGMLELGLLQGEYDALVEEGAYRKFYMHRTGHWLGLDVHDVGDYKVGDAWRLLEPGMALTVEPGMYIPAGSEGVPEEFWDIGIRIEDDVLVTKDGHEVLTEALVSEVDDIEAMMAD
ncbi:MAG: Xaa-Pro aminopeptidase [bacterium]